MELKLENIKNMSREEMSNVNLYARLCVDLVTQREYKVIRDLSVLKEIVENSFNYLSNEFYFEQNYENKSSNYIYTLNCWLKAISNLNMCYEEFKYKLNSLLNMDKELPFIIKDAFEYKKNNFSNTELEDLANKIYDYNIGNIDIQELVKNNLDELSILKKDICLSVSKYGSEHVELLDCEKGYMLMYHSSNNSFNINCKPYKLSNVSNKELQDICDMYDIGFEEE